MNPTSSGHETSTDAGRVALHNYKLPESMLAATDPAPGRAAAPVPATATERLPCTATIRGRPSTFRIRKDAGVLLHVISGTSATSRAPDRSAWNGPALQSVREHIDGRVHPACSECVVHRSYQVHEAAMYPY